LAAASGEVEAVATKGKRYTPSDLAALTGMSLEYLKRIVCCRAIDTLSRFKSRTKGDDVNAQWAEAQLYALAVGERIFGFVESENAGLPGTVDMAPESSEYDAKRVSKLAGRFFGSRAP
jgi:hypothetical protein